MGNAKLVGHIRRSIFVASGFSIVRGVLILAGPLFMLQVYDRVLTSGSLPTLFSLLAITAAILCVAAILEIAARRVLQTAANNLRHSCGAIVVAEHLEKSNGSAGRVAALAKVLEGGEIPTGVDLALLPLFLALLASFHPFLGATAVAILLFGLAIAGVHSFLQSQTRSDFLKAENKNQALLIDFQNNAEALARARIKSNVATRLLAGATQNLRQKVRFQAMQAPRDTASRLLNLLTAPIMLSVGAALVASDALSVGGMIATSMLGPRILSPAARFGPTLKNLTKFYVNLRSLDLPEPAANAESPVDVAHITMNTVSVIPPDRKRAALRMASVEILPGQALAVLGPSGSGKTTMCNVLAGVWTPVAGDIRLGGYLQATPSDLQGADIGYLPQETRLFAGTVAENIDRFASDTREGDVLDAIAAVGAQSVIGNLADGFQTRISSGGYGLSATEARVVALARAVFQSPKLLILDTPEIGLDPQHAEALRLYLQRHLAQGGAAVLASPGAETIKICTQAITLTDGRITARGSVAELRREAIRRAGAAPLQFSGRTV